MKIQTFSIVTGSNACDADCPFCISHITGFDELSECSEINVRNFRKAVQLAQTGGCTTCLFTGKGEPCLYPGEITTYLDYLHDQGDPFPFIELQTNAIRIGEIIHKQDTSEPLTDKEEDLALGLFHIWPQRGLNTIAISTVGIKPEWNKQIYLHHRDIPYPDLSRTIDRLHEHNYTVRLCVMMHQGMVDCKQEVQEIIAWCLEHQVDQLTIRPIRQPGKQSDCQLTSKQEKIIKQFIQTSGTHIMTLMHGGHEARVYDVMGQNVCVSDCLTVEPTSDDIRTLIFYSSGRLTFDWQFRGARLL